MSDANVPEREQSERDEALPYKTERLNVEWDLFPVPLAAGTNGERSAPALDDPQLNLSATLPILPPRSKV